MNRRGFLGVMVGAPVAASVTLKAEPKRPDWLIRWTDVGLRLRLDRRTRMEYAPYGPLDFLELQAPVMDFMVTDFGATFHCVNGCLYHLMGHPGHQETWRIRAVADICSVG